MLRSPVEGMDSSSVASCLPAGRGAPACQVEGQGVGGAGGGGGLLQRGLMHACRKGGARVSTPAAATRLWACWLQLTRIQGNIALANPPCCLARWAWMRGRKACCCSSSLALKRAGPLA